MNPPIDGAAAAETVKTAVTVRSIFTALKENRIEVLLVIVVAHLLGVSDRMLTVASTCAF